MDYSNKNNGKKRGTVHDDIYWNDAIPWMGVSCSRKSINVPWSTLPWRLLALLPNFPMLHKQRDMVFQNDRSFLITVFWGLRQCAEILLITSRIFTGSDDLACAASGISWFTVLWVKTCSSPWWQDAEILPGLQYNVYFITADTHVFGMALRRIHVVPQSKPLDVRCLWNIIKIRLITLSRWLCFNFVPLCFTLTHNILPFLFADVCTFY